MQISVKINVKLDELDIGRVNQIGLVNSSQKLVKKARELAPYKRGNLKKSIGVESSGGFTTKMENLRGIITPSSTEARVGSRKVVYAIRREFENKKNPDRRFYMKRTYDDAERIVNEEFNKAVKIVISNL